MSQLNTNTLSFGDMPSVMGLVGEQSVQDIPAQTWKNLTASRVAGTTYTNNTGRTIVVSLFRNTVAAGSVFVVNGVSVAGHNGTVSYQSNMTIFVPNGATYSYNQPFAQWWELTT